MYRYIGYTARAQNHTHNSISGHAPLYRCRIAVYIHTYIRIYIHTHIYTSGPAASSWPPAPPHRFGVVCGINGPITAAVF